MEEEEGKSDGDEMSPIQEAFCLKSDLPSAKLMLQHSL